MKKNVVLFALLALFAVRSAHAAAGDFWVGLSGGVSSPTGDFSDVADMGFHGIATATYMVTPVFGIGGDLGYHAWGGSDDLNETLQLIDELNGAIPPSEAEGSFDAVQATAHGTFMIPTTGKATPYFQGGLGVYRTRFKVEDSQTIDGDDSSSDFGFNLGGGVNFLVNPSFQFGLGLGYHSIQTEDAATNFFTVAANFLWGAH